MNTKKRFIDAVETVNAIVIALLMLTALKIVLNGIGANYTMIFGGVQMTDDAIKDIIRALSIAVPFTIGSWAFYFIIRIWCKAQRKIEEERS